MKTYLIEMLSLSNATVKRNFGLVTIFYCFEFFVSHHWPLQY